MKRVDKPWGYEEWFVQNEKYVGKFLFIKKGHRLSKQHHVVKDETVYVMTGEMNLMLYDENNDSLSLIRLMKEGSSHRIEPGTIHRMIAIEDTLLIEVSTPEVDDIVRHEDDYGRIKK